MASGNDTLRMTFDEDALNYDKARPGYMSELFDDIFKFSDIGNGSHVVEIGIGTGQATLPFLQAGCDVTAIELGRNLAEFSRAKFSDYPNINVLCGDFMEQRFPEDSLDLVYSATAFHWLPQKEALAKLQRILKPGGTAALFWNHPFPNRSDDPSNMVNRRVYAKYRPSDREIREEIDCGPRIQMLSEAGFCEVHAHVYHRTRTLAADQYIALLNTYSDHMAMPEDVRKAFEADMRSGLAETGDQIRIYDTQSLYLARKA